VLHTVTGTDANTLTNTILCVLRAARKEESKKVSADISCCNVTYYSKPHSLIRHTVISIQFSDQVSLLCVFHSPTPTMPLRRSRVQSCQPFQTSSSLLCPSPSVGTRWVGEWVCMCVCLKHLLKVDQKCFGTKQMLCIAKCNLVIATMWRKAMNSCLL